MWGKNGECGNHVCILLLNNIMSYLVRKESDAFLFEDAIFEFFIRSESFG